MKRITYHLIVTSFILATLSAQGGMRINDQDINDIAKPGQIIRFAQNKENNIAFYFDQNSNSLQIGHNKILSLQKVQEYFNTIQTKLSIINEEKAVTRQADSDVEILNKYLASEKVIVSSKDKVSVHDCAIESPNIEFAASDILIMCVLKNGRYLQLKSSNENALFKIIRFKLAKNAELSIVRGIINMTTGEMPDSFLVSGASKVEMLINERAFKRD
jgi:hypothetical protein